MIADDTAGTEAGLASQPPVRLRQRVAGLYRQMFHSYRKWWRRILPVAAVIFIPVSVLDGLITQGVDSFGSAHEGHVLEGAGLLLAMLAGAITSLLGEVLLAGMISLTLASDRAGPAPSVRKIASELKYGRLLVLDLLFVVMVMFGTVLVLIPGLAVFLLFSLAGPVVELEHKRIWAAFRRSASLVRLDLWLVFWVLVPVELGGNVLTAVIERIGTAVFGHGHMVAAIFEAIAEILISPLFAVAAVLLTLGLSARHRAVAAQP